MRRALAIAIVVISALLPPTSALTVEKMSYVTAGGVYLENIKKAFLEPIGKKLGSNGRLRPPMRTRPSGSRSVRTP